MNKVIAVDFDGTLCKSKWPDIGEANVDVINALKKRQEDGDILILWTCRDGDLLRAAIMWCLARGLKFDAVNDNCRQRIEQYGNNPRKVSADEYWDDRGITVRNGKIFDFDCMKCVAEGGLREIHARTDIGTPVMDSWKVMQTTVAGSPKMEFNVTYKKKSLLRRIWERIGGLCGWR